MAMTKLLTLLALVVALFGGAFFFSDGLIASKVMADTAAAPLCAPIEVELDEGYGVSRHEVRMECSATR
jgi:hypothetical protein